MDKVQLPHPVIAMAATAMETAIHFELVDPIEMQSYCIDPIADGMSMIGNHGIDLRKFPAAAFVTWDGASYLAISYPDEQMVHVVDVTTNLTCKSIGDEETSKIMVPVHRGSRTCYRPDMREMRKFLIDTVFDVIDMRQRRTEFMIADMDADAADALEDTNA
jgi:hypothetical protein